MCDISIHGMWLPRQLTFVYKLSPPTNISVVALTIFLHNPSLSSGPACQQRLPHLVDIYQYETSTTVPSNIYVASSITTRVNYHSRCPTTVRTFLRLRQQDRLLPRWNPRSEEHTSE